MPSGGWETSGNLKYGCGKTLMFTTIYTAKCHPSKYLHTRSKHEKMFSPVHAKYNKMFSFFFSSNIAQRKSEGPVVERRLCLSVYVADGEALLPQQTCSDMVSRMTEVAPATSLCHHRLTSTAENPTLTYTLPVHRSTHTHLSFITSSIYPHHLSWSLGVLKAS